MTTALTGAPTALATQLAAPSTANVAAPSPGRITPTRAPSIAPVVLRSKRPVTDSCPKITPPRGAEKTDEDAQGNPAGHTGQFTPDLQVNLAIRRPAGRSTWRYTQSALNQLRTVTTTTATVSSIALGRVWAG